MPSKEQWTCIYNAMRRNRRPGRRAGLKAIKKACDRVVADIANHRPDIVKAWVIEIRWDGQQFLLDMEDRSAVDQLSYVVEPPPLPENPPKHGRSRPRSITVSADEAEEWAGE